MSKKVVYFSRTGNANRIANTIAAQIDGCELVEITTPVSWRYFWGFLKAGYYTSADRDLDITLSAPIKSDDEIILVTPVWAGKACQPARIFLKNYNNKTTVVFVSSATKSNEISGIGNIVGSFDITAKEQNESATVQKVLAIV